MNSLQENHDFTPKSRLAFDIFLVIFIIALLAYLTNDIFFSQKSPQQVTTTTTTAITVMPTPTIYNFIATISPAVTPTAPVPAKQFNLVSSLPSNILNTTLYFQREDGLYKLSPLNSQPQLFLNANYFAFSSDNKKVAYIDDSKGFDAKNKTYQFFVYDLETKQTKTYLITEKDRSMKGIANDISMRGIAWSPQNKYILVNEGTGPSAGITFVYDTNTGNLVNYFIDDVSLDDLTWHNDETIYNSAKEDVNVQRPWGFNWGYSLVELNIRTGSFTKIKKADDLNDYYPIAVKNGCLYYARYYVNSPGEWTSSTYKELKDYHCLDIQTETTRDATSSEVQTDYSSIVAKVSAMIQPDEELDQHVWPPDDFSLNGWHMMQMRLNGGTVFDYDLYLVNINNPEKTLTHIVKGGSYHWIK